MYYVTFYDCYGYKVTERFFHFDDAANYWDHWAGLPIYVSGTLTDREASETLWQF